MAIEYLEKQILGCIFKDNTLAKETTIQAHHFSDPKNRRVFEIMTNLTNQGKPIDNVTMITAAYDDLPKLGGPDYVTKLTTVGHIENFETYESDLINAYKDRETQRIVQNWLSNPDRDNQELIREVQRVDDMNTGDESRVIDLLTILHDKPYESMDKIIHGIPSGLSALDKLTGGFQDGDSFILGARPSMGKTATMLKFAASAQENGDVPIIFSLEMADESLLKRMISARAKVNSFLARNPQRLSDEQKKAWTKAVGEISNMPMEVWDKPMQTVQYIRSKVRKARKKYEGKRIIVFIDYLTLINNPGNFSSDHGKVSDISARLKAIAKEYHCPVITLAQLSRGVESRPIKRPMLSDLRESGSIEQDADVVAFLYRESYYDPKPENKNILEIIVAKQREGPTGKAEVYYNKQTGEMGDLSDR